jgi:polysaccharide export outer membrane protein
MMGLLLALALAGCSRYAVYAPGTVIEIDDQNSAIVDLQEVTVPPPPAMDPTSSTEYRVGAGDVLSISVPGLVERSNVETRTDSLGGFRVYTSGKILLPLVGGVEVGGLTVEEIHGKLVEAFSAYIKKPVVSVEILEFKSQPLYLLGKFGAPGLYYLDRPTSLLHGIALGGGLGDAANLRGARLIRSDKVQPVDIYQLLYNNDLRQNVQLHPGDAIYVPGNDEQRVYVFGRVGSPGPVDMLNGRLNLLQALSTAGLDGKPYDHEHVRIIRSLSPTHGQLMVVDLAQMVDGHALPMALMDGDIIYVPKTRLGGWNEAMEEILPSFAAIGAVIQPFVQIKYLDD